MKKFVDWLVFGPENDGQNDGQNGGQNDDGDWDEGFREARTERATTTEEEEAFDEAFHRAIRRRHTSDSTRSRRLDESGGGLIDLQVGSRVFNDVPAKMRTELWMSKLHSSSAPSRTSPCATYEDCLARQRDPDVMHEIEKDIHRTFPGHVTLTSPAGQTAMRNVLCAYATYDPDVGYSQGMNFLVGLLLTYLTPPYAFSALLLIMVERGLRAYYLPDGMVHLQARLWQLSKLIDPGLERHLEEYTVLPVLYASSWVLTCFAAEFPLKFSARVLDCLITDSFELPIMKVSVAILERCRDDILQLHDMEEIIELLRKQVPAWPERRLMDLLTGALSQPWTAQDKAVLADERMVESVAEAVRRVDGVECGGEERAGEDAGDGGDGWEPQWEDEQRISPFQSGLMGTELIDITTETASEHPATESVSGNQQQRGTDTAARVLSLDNSMRHLLQSFTEMSVSSSMDTASLDQLRDIVFSSSFNYGQREPQSAKIEPKKEDDFGEWEGPSF